MKKRFSIALFLFMAILLISACTPPAEVVTKAPSKTPTNAPIASGTPQPAPDSTETTKPTTTPWPEVLVGVVQVHSLNIRSGPGTDNPVIRIAKQGEEILILGEYINDDDQKWLLTLMADDSFAWIFGDPYYISEKMVSVSYMQYKTLLRTVDESKQLIDEPFISAIAGSLPDPTGTAQPINDPLTSTLFCADTLDNVGSIVVCEIPQAYCSYQSGIFGKPTFCYDALHPTHNFRLVTWGSDWSDYDGSCIVVTGPVSLYAGKPQIEATDRSQIAICP